MCSNKSRFKVPFHGNRDRGHLTPDLQTWASDLLKIYYPTQ
jgi:hypothetical protein